MQAEAKIVSKKSINQEILHKMEQIVGLMFRLMEKVALPWQPTSWFILAGILKWLFQPI